ncbi:MAG TPA: metallophosphoesterase [Terriglobia bacterium]|nr:metallophosphoesterase [Terriglobia bacterium]
MGDCNVEFQVTRDLEKRLARRRAVEADIRAGRWRKANKDLLLVPDRIAARMLRAALRMTGLYSRGIRNALAPVVRHARLEFENLPESFDGFRILHLADLHIDGLDGLAEAVAERVEGLDADLCVMTGDYRFDVGGPHDAVYPRLLTILSRIRAPHGVVAILGNHDEADMAMKLENLGVQLLVNEALEIANRGGRLWVIGVDDPHYYGCDDLDGALEDVPAEAFKVLLAHSPEMFREAAVAGIDLYFCGHTHAGQICLPGIGPLRVNAACPRHYTHGHWKHGAMRGHTSAGVGCALLPVRYNCPPEIGLIELVRKETGDRSQESGVRMNGE